MDPQSIPNQRVPDLGRDEEEEDSEDSDEDYFLEDFQPLSAEKGTQNMCLCWHLEGW